MPTQHTALNENSLKPVGANKAEQQQTRGHQKKKAVLINVLTIAGILLIIVSLLLGFFYSIISKDINGVAVKYRNQISRIPILKAALPEPLDPEDPNHLSDIELLNKYNELRALRDKLQNDVKIAEGKTAQMQKFKDEYDINTAELEKQRAKIDADMSQLDIKLKQYSEDKKALDEIIAMGDKEGFKTYFEKIDKKNAAVLYEKIIVGQKADEAETKFSKLYEVMDAAAAAGILEQMGTDQMDVIVSILKNMKQESASKIVSSMDTAFAAEVTAALLSAYKK